MKKLLDKFSNQASTYKKFRPTYPSELLELVYSHCTQRDSAWDCATGNGQVAVELAKEFKNVVATDISEKQLKHAVQKTNISYSVQRAEKTDFADQSFDLITVAQAMHWFDFKVFNEEANRVLKRSGIIAVWGYGLMRVNPTIDVIIDNYYDNVIGPYWNEERRHIDAEYKTIPFNFEEIQIRKTFQIKVKWNLEQMKGYFNSWSAVQNYLEKDPDNNPVLQMMSELGNVWPYQEMEITFPLFVRIGKPR